MKGKIAATKPDTWQPVHQPPPSWDAEHAGHCALRGVHGAWVPWPCPDAPQEAST